MGKLRPSVGIIYESPDNGETVYGRYAGETDRWLVGRSAKANDFIDELKEKQLWGEIHRAAKTNPLLQEAIDRVKILYELSKKNGKE